MLKKLALTALAAAALTVAMTACSSIDSPVGSPATPVAAHTATATATAKPAASPVGTRANPVPLNAPVSIRNLVTVQVIGVEDGTAAVAATNQFNSPPTSGHYFAIHVKYTYTGKASFNPATALTASFVTAGGNSVTDTIIDGPASWVDEMSAGDVFPGASVTVTYVFDMPDINGTLRLQEFADVSDTFFALS